MQISKAEILKILYQAIGELNEQFQDCAQIVVSENTILLGEGGQLDSLGVVNFVIAIEERIEARFGVFFAVPVETLSMGSEDPWRSIGSLADYLAKQLNDSRRY